ncbi:MAG: hypothetical protein ACKVPY_07115 [Paracoccaceae bacterium]
MSQVDLSSLGSGAATAGLDAKTPGGRFRRDIVFSVPTGGAAQAASVAAGAVLRLAFAARDVDARAPGAPEPATLAPGGAGLVLTLPVARRIVRINLSSSPPSHKVAVFRADGDAVSESAVAVFGPAGDVTDARLILRRRSGTDDVALSPSHIVSTVLRYAPVNSRVGFSLAGDNFGETFLPPVTDASGQPVFPALMDRGADFAKALADRLSGGSGLLPDPLVITLILEADEPCNAAVEAFGLALVLEKRGFSDGEGKRVLRFPGGRRDVQRVALTVPSGAVVVGAGLTLTMAGVARTGVRVAQEEPLPDAGGDGIALLPQSPAATRLLLVEAVACLGVDAIVAADGGPAEFVASLWDDREGLPGTRLVESAPVPLVTARPAALAFDFPRAVALPAGPVWLVIDVVRGRGVALLTERFGGNVAQGGDGGFTRLAAGTDLGVAARLRFPAPAGSAMVGQGLGLSLAGTPVPLLETGGRLSAELAGPIQALGTPRPVLIEVEVATSVKSIVTVDPPTLRYTLS